MALSKHQRVAAEVLYRAHLTTVTVEADDGEPRPLPDVRDYARWKRDETLQNLVNALAVELSLQYEALGEVGFDREKFMDVVKHGRVRVQQA